jgi:hypothetical protein
MTNMKRELILKLIQEKITPEKDKHITFEVGMQIIKFGCSIGHRVIDRFSSQLKNQIINEVI